MNKPSKPGCFKHNIPSSLSDVGAKGYGIVVFETKPTIPYSAILSKRWNIGFAYSFELFSGI